MAAWVYIVRCADGSCYVGCTTNLDQRWGQHMAGLCAYASIRRPLVMVWSDEFQSVMDAAEVERQIKRWSRLKKEALIRGDYHALPRLSRRGFRPASFETPADAGSSG